MPRQEPRVYDVLLEASAERDLKNLDAPAFGRVVGHIKNLRGAMGSGLESCGSRMTGDSTGQAYSSQETAVGDSDER